MDFSFEFVNTVFRCLVSCMRETTLTQSGARGRAIGWTKLFTLANNTIDFVDISNVLLFYLLFILLGLMGVELLL